MVELYNCHAKRVFFSRNFTLTASQLLQPTVDCDVAQTRSTPMQHPPSFRAQTKPPPFVPASSQRESHVHVSSPRPLRSVSPSLRLSDDACRLGVFCFTSPRLARRPPLPGAHRSGLSQADLPSDTSATRKRNDYICIYCKK